MGTNSNRRAGMYVLIVDAIVPVAFFRIDPMCSLYEAVELLLGKRIHRLPMIDEESHTALGIMTLKRILFAAWNAVRFSAKSAARGVQWVFFVICLLSGL